MKITSLSEQGVGATNEDSLLVDTNLNIFGVFDGASSLTGYVTPEGNTGGYLASSLAASAFAEHSSNIIEAAHVANSRIEATQTTAGVNLSKNYNRFGTTAAVVKVNHDTIEILQTGDSVAIVRSADGNVTIPLGYTDQDITTMRKWRKLADEGASNIRDLVNDDVLAQREIANVDYGMLNGDPRAQDHILTTTISKKDITTILLLTDGLYLPKANPDTEEDWAEYMNIFLSSGLEGLYQQVRSKELLDPELIKYPRFKLHDDASGIAIDFTAP